jgi:hypothetical protein
MAIYDFGLTSEQFFELTPRQFHAISLRHVHANERVELLMGVNTSAIVSSSMNPPKKGSCPADYMPSMWAKRQETAPKVKKFNRQKFADDLRKKFKAMSEIPGSNVIRMDASKTD